MLTRTPKRLKSHRLFLTIGVGFDISIFFGFATAATVYVATLKLWPDVNCGFHKSNMRKFNSINISHEDSTAEPLDLVPGQGWIENSQQMTISTIREHDEINHGAMGFWGTPWFRRNPEMLHSSWLGE
jgi:hypothetical protein